MKPAGNSIRTQLILSSFVGLAFIIISLSYILVVTLQLQGIVNDQFQTERFFQDLQREVVGIQQPLVEYLSSRSSQALAELLADEQVVRGMLPQDRPITDDPFQLLGREIFFLIDAYLDLVHDAVALKRGRAIEEYTALLETIEDLNSHISERIDAISLFGLRRELASYEQVIMYSRQLLFWNLAVAISAFLTSIFLIFLSISRVTEPMHHLAVAAGELSSGNFEVEDVEVRAVSEVGAVVAAFNRMKRDIRQYIQELNRQKEIEQGYMAEKLRNMKMEELLKRMELYTMQAHMNPHFLFNTINTGVQLAIMENAERTADFMENLAHFFRTNLRERNLIVPLRNEIAGLRSYIYILRIRFPRTLDVSLRVPDELLDQWFVPAMILQPLVENSVIHAFPGTTRHGTIDISAHVSGKRLILTVQDNGIGIDPDRVRRMLHRHSREDVPGTKVMGLENVIQRLYFFYPDLPDVITIDGSRELGTRVCITLDGEVEPCIPS